MEFQIVLDLIATSLVFETFREYEIHINNANKLSVMKSNGYLHSRNWAETLTLFKYILA